MRISIIVELPDLTPSSPTASAVMDELENAVRPALDAIGHYWWLDMEGGETRYAPEERELPCFQIGLWTGFNMTEWETLETIQVADKLTAEKYAELHYPGVGWYIRPESGRCHEDCGCPHCGRDCEPGESQCGDSDCPRHDNA
jgi:hypothetical protein